MLSDTFLQSAREFLAERNFPEAVQVLETAAIEILQDGDARRKCDAANWLGSLRASAHAGRIALEQALADMDSYEVWHEVRVFVSECAARALGRRRDVWSVPRLCELVQNGTPQLKCAAASALGDMGEGAQQAIPILSQALANEESFLSFVDPLFPDQREYTRVNECAAVALAQIDPEAAVAAVPILTNCLSSVITGNQWRRRQACELLGRIGPAAACAVPELIALLAYDPNPADPYQPAVEVLDAAATALVRLGKWAEPALAAALRESPCSEEVRQRLSSVLQRLRVAGTTC